MSFPSLAWSRAALGVCASLTLGVACAEERNTLEAGASGSVNAGTSAGAAAGESSGGTTGGSAGTSSAGSTTGGAGAGGSSGSSGSAGQPTLPAEGGATGEAGANGTGVVPCATTAPDPDCTCQFHDNHDYWICKEAAGTDFASAKGKCETAGMTLAELSGAVEDSWLYNAAFATTGSYWIGATDANPTEGTWTWGSGAEFWLGMSGGTASGYAGWRHAEPSGGGNCASVETGDVWDDRACADLLGFVCEAPGGSTEAEPYVCGTTALNLCTCTSNAGSDYVYCNYNQTWATARERCLSLGMDLVEIDSDAENTWLLTPTAGDAVWTSGNDRAGEDAWRWEPSGIQFWSGNGSDVGGVAVDGAFTDWNTGAEPNDSGGNQDCLVLQSTGTPNWDDLDCAAGRRFLCESL